MRDQGFLLREFEPELLAQERGQARLDLFGLGLGSGEPEQMIVRLCRCWGYAEVVGVVLVGGGGVARRSG
jgi:hypothetical protein